MPVILGAALEDNGTVPATACIQSLSGCLWPFPEAAAGQGSNLYSWGSTCITRVCVPEEVIFREVFHCG